MLIWKMSKHWKEIIIILIIKIKANPKLIQSLIIKLIKNKVKLMNAMDSKTINFKVSEKISKKMLLIKNIKSINKMMFSFNKTLSNKILLGMKNQTKI